MVIITENLIGSASTITSSFLSIITPSIGVVITSSTAMLTNFAILTTNEYISKMKTRYTKLLDWNNVLTLLYGKTLKQSMIDKNINQREAEDLEQNTNHYLDKRSGIMKNTQFKVEDFLVL